jgi:hypothetical protein
MSRFLFYRFTFVILLVGAWLQNESMAAETPMIESPIFCEATTEFQVMKTTLYQYQLRVDRAAGSYRYDCVGFVSYALRQATPAAWSTLIKVTGVTTGHIPNPVAYRSFLAGLAQHSQPGWQAVTNISELRPGDIVAWEHKTETAIGHALIIGSFPMAETDGGWSVEVYDSTSFPHGNDSRPNDPRTQKMETNDRPNGLGKGKIVLIADPVSGALTGFRWSPRAKIVLVPIAAGRPVF